MKTLLDLGKIKMTLLAFMVFMLLASAISAVQPWWHNLVARAESARVEQFRDERIRQAARANRLINSTLNQAIVAVPSATRIRVALLHRFDGAVPVRFDVTYIAALPGNAPGELMTNVPLAQWNAYIGRFLAGKCALVSVADPHVTAEELVRLKILNTAAFLGCPIMGDHGTLLGAVFFNWDVPSMIPPAVADLVPMLTEIANKIAPVVPDL